MKKSTKTTRMSYAAVGLDVSDAKSAMIALDDEGVKEGDRLMRRLLVQSGHYILGSFEDCDLRRHGTAIAARGGKNAKKRAAVAVARKLAVLLHHLWIAQDKYVPLMNQTKQIAAYPNSNRTEQSTKGVAGKKKKHIGNGERRKDDCGTARLRLTPRTTWR